jgi:type IV secretion system protein VirB10
MKIPNQKQNPNNNSNEEDDSIDIDNSGPSIASLKNNKLIIIICSALLITIVIYFFFFKGSNRISDEKIVEVLPDVNPQVAPNDSGKSIFEFEKPSSKNEIKDPELLKSQESPEVPSLPDLPKEMIATQQLNLSPNDKDLAKDSQPNSQAVITQNPQQNPQAIPQPIPQAVPQQNPQAIPQAIPKTPEQLAIERNQALINQQIIDQQKLASQNPISIDAQKNEIEKKKLEENIKLDPRYTPIIVFSGGYTSPTQAIGNKENIIQVKKNPIDELKESETSVDATYIADGSVTIAQGKMISAILETAINTEMPGAVRAVISRDIFGESGNKILIPRGSRLYGAYSSSIQRGQARVQIGWTRLIRPDGVSLNINFTVSDQFGRAGIPGDVDNRYSSVITNSLLTSILTVGGVTAAQKLINNNTNSTTTVNQNQGITTTTTNATNQAIYDVTKTILDTIGQIITNSIDLNPVIRIPQGTKVTVIVNSDIKIPPVNKR